MNSTNFEEKLNTILQEQIGIKILSKLKKNSFKNNQYNLTKISLVSFL